MAVWTDRSVVYHIPKCGGIWVKAAIRRSGLPYGRCRDLKIDHPFGLKREHAAPAVVREEDKIGKFSFCFVRHPLGWLRSFWCYRTKSSWLSTKFPADRYWDDMFDIFVDNLMGAYPEGFVTQLYQYYVNEVDFVGRQENLADDLIEALTLAGEAFDEAALRNTKWRNMAASGKRFRNMCPLSRRTEQRMLQAESWVLKRFYRD